jgi:hypothetical protein
VPYTKPDPGNQARVFRIFRRCQVKYVQYANTFGWSHEKNRWLANISILKFNSSSIFYHHDFWFPFSDVNNMPFWWKNDHPLSSSSGHLRAVLQDMCHHISSHFGHFGATKLCGWLRNPAPPKGWLKPYK